MVFGPCVYDRELKENLTIRFARENELYHPCICLRSKWPCLELAKSFGLEMLVPAETNPDMTNNIMI